MRVLYSRLIVPLASILLTAQAARSESDLTRKLAADDLRNMAQARFAVSEVSAVRRPEPKIIVGDPTSSLTAEQAIELAQEFAARLPKGFVARLPADYTGEFAPIVPTNAVFIVEPVTAASVHPFDLVVFSVPLKGITIRRLLSISGDSGVVGFEFQSGELHTEIKLDACIGRVVATILFAPSAPPKST